VYLLRILVLPSLLWDLFSNDVIYISDSLVDSYAVFKGVSEKNIRDRFSMKRLTFYNFLCILYFICIYYETDLRGSLLYCVDS
jgi:hypothetical protein